MSEPTHDFDTNESKINEPDTITPREAPDADASARRFRGFAWALGVIGFLAFVMLARINTYLGVQAVPWDKSGHEYVWRVWWRARNDIIQSGPGWVFLLAYVALALAFIGLSAVAFWIALVPDDRTVNMDRESAPEPVAQP
jgi:hypothetical protein